MGKTIENWAQILDQARLEARELPRITEEWPDLRVEDGYRIQAAGIRLRTGRGERIVGYKMGLTSEAKRQQMNLHSPCYGVLTEEMRVKDGRFPLKGSIHPKIEPEVAFCMGRDLRGRVTEAQVLEACTGVAVALEILDSRFVGFKYFSLPDVVADNSSSAWFALGEVRKDFHSLNLADLPMRMSVNGKVATEARSSEISGDPVRSVVQLCELLAKDGKSLPAGSWVLAGAATAAVPLEPGMTVGLEVDGLPSLEVRVS